MWTMSQMYQRITRSSNRVGVGCRHGCRPSIGDPNENLSLFPRLLPGVPGHVPVALLSLLPNRGRSRSLVDQMGVLGRYGLPPHRGCAPWRVGSNSGDNDDDEPVAVALVVHGVLGLRLGFCEHFGEDGVKIIARAYSVPDTGWCYQAFASDSCRENWRVPSLDPGLAA